MASRDIRTMTGQMLEGVVRADNLLRAFKRVKSNKGAPGVDGMTVEEPGQWLDAHPEELRSDLLRERYRPAEIRGVSIPKPGGGERLLGIPTVLDRLAQQALLQELEPVFDPGFPGSSHGFRPGRSAHDALKRGASYAKEGYVTVADLDLELERRGHKFCRYADDVNIYVRSRKAGERVMSSVTRFLEK
ncbi:MAG: group II intron reverse transcriptase/maturase, partial [Planctomycetota bacterium]|nr:group II intron reverse transcriptase/maturase [Planctomycetota bacterium]